MLNLIISPQVSSHLFPDVEKHDSNVHTGRLRTLQTDPFGSKGIYE